MAKYSIIAPFSFADGYQPLGGNHIFILSEMKWRCSKHFSFKPKITQNCKVLLSSETSFLIEMFSKCRHCKGTIAFFRAIFFYLLMKHAPSLESNTTCCEMVGNAGPAPIRVLTLHFLPRYLYFLTIVHSNLRHYTSRAVESSVKLIRNK
jgi:hypothetical protein